MTKETLENYKKKLQHERLLIVREIKDFEKPVDLGGYIDYGDEKTDEAERYRSV